MLNPGNNDGISNSDLTEIYSVLQQTWCGSVHFVDVVLCKLLFLFFTLSCLIPIVLLKTLYEQEWSRMNKNDQEWTRMIKNEKEWSRMIKNDQEWTRMNKIDQEWSRMIKNNQEWTRLIKND